MTNYRESFEALIDSLPSNYAAETAVMNSSQNADDSIGVDCYEAGIVAVDQYGTANEAWYSIALSTLLGYLDDPATWDGFRVSEGGYCADEDVADLIARFN